MKRFCAVDAHLMYMVLLINVAWPHFFVACIKGPYFELPLSPLSVMSISVSDLKIQRRAKHIIHE